MTGDIAEAGWLDDPTKRHEHRYWDGAQWTDHVADQGVAAQDPFDESQVVSVANTLSNLRDGVASKLKDAKAAHDVRRETAAAEVAAEAERPDDEAGSGQFGNGTTAALYEFQASRYKGGRMFTPNVIRVWSDRIEEYEHHAVRKKNTNAIGFGQVAQVRLSQGLRWSDITVESTGGHTITLVGVPKAQAGQVKSMIEDAIEKWRPLQQRSDPVTVTATPEAQPLAVQLRELAALRDEGILSDEEFATQKARLLG